MQPKPAASDRRTSHRMPVSLDAVLYYNSLMLPDCRLRDISPDGAFVVTSGSFLPDHARVDLAIGMASGQWMSQRFAARVMRSTEEGVGLRLEHDPTSMRGLIETLYSA